MFDKPTFFAGIQNKLDFQSAIYLPCQDITGIPIYNGGGIKPALLYRNISNINTPNMIRKGSLYPIEKIGVYFWQDSLYLCSAWDKRLVSPLPAFWKALFFYLHGNHNNCPAML